MPTQPFGPSNPDLAGGFPGSHGNPGSDGSSMGYGMGIGGVGAPCRNGTPANPELPLGLPPASPGIEGAGADPAAPLAVTWRPGCGRKARTGDVEDRAGGRIVLSGRSEPSAPRSHDPVTDEEARLIVPHVERQAFVGAAVVADMAGAPVSRSLPRDSSDRTEAGRRLSWRVLKRVVPPSEMAKALRRIGWKPKVKAS